METLNKNGVSITQTTGEKKDQTSSLRNKNRENI